MLHSLPLIFCFPDLHEESSFPSTYLSISWDCTHLFLSFITKLREIQMSINSLKSSPLTWEPICLTLCLTRACGLSHFLTHIFSNNKCICPLRMIILWVICTIMNRSPLNNCPDQTRNSSFSVTLLSSQVTKFCGF